MSPNPRTSEAPRTAQEWAVRTISDLSEGYGSEAIMCGLRIVCAAKRRRTLAVALRVVWPTLARPRRSAGLGTHAVGSLPLPCL